MSCRWKPSRRSPTASASKAANCCFAPTSDLGHLGRRFGHTQPRGRYLQRIRKGEVTTRLGRPIPHNDDIPGFCYVIADLTPKLAERCKLHHDLTETHDHMGFFGYKRNAKAYVEVISFERLVEAAKQRNRAFFDKLGLPS